VAGERAPWRRRTRVHLVLFQTEGPPHDLGLPLTQEADLLRDVARDAFDSVVVATPRSLLGQDASWAPLLADHRSWVERQPGYSPELRWNRSWAANGLQAWKSRLILERLHHPDVDDGDIVLYHDVNVTRYPEYLEGVRRWSGFQRRRLRQASVLLHIDGSSDLRQDVKHELLSDRLGELAPGFVPSAWSGCLAVRRDAEGLRFIEDWMELNAQPDLLSPVTSPPFDPRFFWHTADQATLGVLWHARIAAGDDRAIRVANLRGRRIPPRSRASWSVLKDVAGRRAPRAVRLFQHVRRSLRTTARAVVLRTRQLVRAPGGS